MSRTLARRPHVEQKRLVLIAGGHVTTDRHALIRESLAWLDRYRGPVASGGDGS